MLSSIVDHFNVFAQYTYFLTIICDFITKYAITCQDLNHYLWCLLAHLMILFSLETGMHYLYVDMKH